MLDHACLLSCECMQARRGIGPMTCRCRSRGRVPSRRVMVRRDSVCGVRCHSLPSVVQQCVLSIYNADERRIVAAWTRKKTLQKICGLALAKRVAFSADVL